MGFGVLNLWPVACNAFLHADMFGDARGGCIRAFPHFKASYLAYYYAGAGLGATLGVFGEGATAELAARDLWSKLHGT